MTYTKKHLRGVEELCAEVRLSDMQEARVTRRELASGRVNLDGELVHVDGDVEWVPDFWTSEGGAPR